MSIKDVNKGVEWPEFEGDSGYVSIGDEFVNDDLCVRKVISIEFERDDFTLWDDHGQPNTYPYGYKLKRGVVDADNHLIAIGDTVWTLEEPTHHYKVVDYAGIGVLLEDNDGKHESREASELTHEFPFFDVNHKRLNVGDEVYGISDGTEYTVSYVEDGRFKVKRKSDGEEICVIHKTLAHGKPVIGADELPILEGETVYGVRNGDKYHVIELRHGNVMAQDENGSITSFAPNLLTHKLVGRDGKFIEVGDTVYSTITGMAFEVSETDKYKAYSEDGMVGDFGYPAKWLTHKDPSYDSEDVEEDSWSSVWYDVARGDIGPDDMELRCRKLAGVSDE